MSNRLKVESVQSGLDCMACYSLGALATHDSLHSNRSHTTQHMDGEEDTRTFKVRKVAKTESSESVFHWQPSEQLLDAKPGM